MAKAQRGKGKVINLNTATTEKELREQIRDLCKLFGWRFWFCWSSIHSPRGMPDLILARPPRLLFCELKSEKGKVTPHQQVWIDTLIGCGVEVFVWRPADIEDIVTILRS